MKVPNIYIYIVALLIGVSLTVVQYVLNVHYGYTQAQLSKFWILVGYPYFLLSSLIISFVKKVKPWKWGLLLITGHYISTIIVQGSQFPPFEIAFMLIMSVPIMLFVYVGNYLSDTYTRKHI
jgi:hypothetical protein